VVLELGKWDERVVLELGKWDESALLSPSSMARLSRQGPFRTSGQTLQAALACR
jgi:hypothetical protein